MSLVCEDGIVGFIVPHKFMKIKAGQELRKIVASGKHLLQVVHFGKEQLFKPSSTYTCLLFLSKSRVPHFEVELVQDLHQWMYFPDERTSLTIDATEISAAPWLFIGGKLKQLIERINGFPKRLSNYADVFVGLQTSCDEVYVVKPISAGRGRVTVRDTSGKLRTLEKNFSGLRYTVLTIFPFMSPQPNSFMIFPYYQKDGKFQAYTEHQIRREYPSTYKYLLSHKKELLKRNVSGFEPDKWFKYGRSQSLTKFDGREKLIVKVLSLEPCFTYDKENLRFTGGGNGPYYGVDVKRDQRISISFLQGVLNSKLMDLFVKSWSSVFRGGYYSYGKQFIEKLPMININLDNQSHKEIHDKIVKIVQRLMRSNASLETAKIPAQREQTKAEMAALIDELNETVYDMYGLTDDEKQYLRALDLSGENL